MLWKQMLLLLTNQVNSSLTLHHNTRVIHLTSSRHEGTLPSDIITRRVSAHDILRDRDHIHLTSIIVYYYNCSTLLLVVVNLLMCLIYKLNFIMGVYV